MRTSANGQTGLGAGAGGTKADLSEGACFNDTRVEVARHQKSGASPSSVAIK